PLAGALRGGWGGRTRGSPAVGSAAPGRRGAGGGGDVDPAATAARGDALVEPAAGRGVGGRLRDGGADLAQLGPAALAGRDVQVLHRSGTGGEGPRCGRAVFAPAGERR